MMFGENSGHGFAIKARCILPASLRFLRWRRPLAAGNQDNALSRLHLPGASSPRKTAETKLGVTSWSFSSRRTARSSVGFKSCVRRALHNLDCPKEILSICFKQRDPLMATNFGVESWINLLTASSQGFVRCVERICTSSLASMGILQRPKIGSAQEKAPEQCKCALV